MPGLDVQSNSLVTSTQPYPSSVASLAAQIKAKGLTQVSQALMLLQKHCEDNSAALRQNSPEVTHIIATDQNGNMVAQIGELPTKDGRILYGLQGVTLYVGDVLGDGDPSDAPVYADGTGVHIGKSGWADVLDPYGVEAAWLGTQFDAIQVTGAVNNGSGLIRLTVPGHTLQTGDTPRVLNVGGVPNATGQRAITVIDSSHIDLQNSVFAGTYTSGGTVDRILHVTGAANNGSGLIRLTLTGHTYQSEDQVNVANVGGVPNATGQWIVTLVDANHVDLQGSTFAGSYTSGGTSLRYFAGGLFENIAIGQSFANYSLRAFPNGTLKINNALITLTGTGTGSATITLDPTLGTITVAANSPSTLVTLIDAGGVSLTSTIIHQPGVFIANDSFQIWYDVNGATLTGPAVQITPDEVGLLDGTGTATITLTGSTGDIVSATLHVSPVAFDIHGNATGFNSIDSVAYKVGGTPGLGVAQTIVSSVIANMGTYVTSVTGTGVSSTSASAVASLTLVTKVMTYSSGLLTADV